MNMKYYLVIKTESEQNDFLHRLVVKFDERQQYFISCVITVIKSSIKFNHILYYFYILIKQRHFRDFISLLPRKITFQILNHLNLRELSRTRQV